MTLTWKKSWWPFINALNPLRYVDEHGQVQATVYKHFGTWKTSYAMFGMGSSWMRKEQAVHSVEKLFSSLEQKSPSKRELKRLGL